MPDENKPFLTQLAEAANQGYRQGTDLGQGKVMRRNIVAKRLKEARKNAGMTQEQVATAINTNRLTFSGYESGRYEQSIEVLCRIADVYNVSLDYLAGRTDNPKWIDTAQQNEDLLARVKALEEKLK